MNYDRIVLAIRRTNKYLYAQLLAAPGKILGGVKGRNAEEVGTAIAKLAKDKKITKVAFQRGRLKYHGLVKLLADSARKGGLEF